MKPRVVITGYGFATPLGCEPEIVWKRVLNGESGIDLISEEEMRIFRSNIAGECRDFSMDGYLPTHESRRIERFAQFSVASGMDAVKMAELDFEKIDRLRCASVVGSGVGGLMEIEKQHSKLIEKGPSKVSPFTIPKIMGNASAGNLSIIFGLNGPTYSVASACASANNAMIDAFKLIQDDDADVVLTGGSEAAVSSLGLAGFSVMRALSERNNNPKAASRPFDKDRDGFVLSEGGGILVFENEKHALERGAKIYGEILGYGMTSDATHITQPDQNGEHAARAMTNALRKSRINPEDVQYINAHGTSTKLGDIAETNAIKAAFGEHAYKLSISSSKGHIGHLLGGSGGVELILTLLAIRDGIIPHTLNLENPDPLCDLDFTPIHPKKRSVNIAMSNSFGFGGHNSCIVVAAYR